MPNRTTIEVRVDDGSFELEIVAPESIPAAGVVIVPSIFGLNEEADRWLRDDPLGPRWVRLANRAAGPLLSRLPDSLQGSTLKRQSASIPFLSPQPPTSNTPPNLLDSGPLYAGECVARIHDIRPAGELVRELADGS